MTSTIVAWIGALGAFANAAALFIVERRRRRIDATLTATYQPGLPGPDRYGDSHPSEVVLHLQAAPHTIISEAGVSWKAGWLRPAKRMVRAYGRAAGHSKRLPASTGDAAYMWISIHRTDLEEAGVPPDAELEAWVRTAGKQTVRAVSERFTLLPEFDEDSS